MSEGASWTEGAEGGGAADRRQLADVALQEGRRTRLLAVLGSLEAVGVTLAAAVVEGHAALLRVVEVPARKHHSWWSTHTYTGGQS